MNRPLWIALFGNLVVGGLLLAADRTPLKPEQQAKFLTTRTDGSIIGTFNSYCSLLFAVQDIAIHTDDKAVAETSLQSPFPKFYKPTWKELFESIARQTQTSWSYDSKRDYWVFNKPAQPIPFQIELANGWKSDDRGVYVGYIPPVAPVGMDIYMMGTFSAQNGDAELFRQIREDIALHFAMNFKRDVTLKEMSVDMVGSYAALHFKIAVQKTGIVWRQWIVVESGQAFVIVSAIKPEDEERILPDVKTMLKSFTITPVAPTSGDQPPNPKTK